MPSATIHPWPARGERDACHLAGEDEVIQQLRCPIVRLHNDTDMADVLVAGKVHKLSFDCLTIHWPEE